MNKELFQEETKQIDSQIEIIAALDSVNTRLKQYNWAFLHPYAQGGDIELLERILDGSTDPEKDILSFFARKFFDLRTTIHFIDGFFRTRPFLNDHIQAIQESVVLCLQKDFRGGISILIPVIEGTLRKYLIARKGEHKKTEIDISELLQSFRLLTEEYVELQKKYSRERHKHLVETNRYLDSNQEKSLMKKHREYFELWLKQLKDYIQHSLYLNTKENNVTDNFNRHLIFHALDDQVEFTLGNYLRLFNCLHFLSWSIGSATEDCSILSVAKETDVQDKFVDYYNILIASEALAGSKSRIYDKPVERFQAYLDPRYNRAISKPVERVKKVFRWNDFMRKSYLW